MISGIINDEKNKEKVLTVIFYLTGRWTTIFHKQISMAGENLNLLARYRQGNTCTMVFLHWWQKNQVKENLISCLILSANKQSIYLYCFTADFLQEDSILTNHDFTVQLASKLTQDITFSYILFEIGCKAVIILYISYILHSLQHYALL